MTQEIKHTPTPWKIHDENTSVVSTDSLGGCAACMGKNKITNAAFILRACNAHDELVAALEAARGYVSANCAANPGFATPKRVLEGVDTALAKARGEA